MKFDEKIKQLRTLIDCALKPYINSDYVFLDLPYHSNVGDTLIAMAAKNYLSQFSHKCLYSSSEFTFDDRTITPSTLIIFNGGGNFGDLWQNYSVFRNKVIKKYPNNNFLILPQSVSYNNRCNLDKDIKLFSACPNITICARDRQSYEFLKNNFTLNNVLLVPDMAFYSNLNYFKPARRTGRTLFLRRDDIEFVDNPKYSIIPKDAEIHDWPTLENKPFLYRILYLFMKINKRESKYIKKSLAWKIEDAYWQKVLHPYNVRSGIAFVNKYDIVYTTRLHVAVISMMLGKKTYFFDNSYHKNSALYNTWLEDVDNISLIG